MRVTRFGYFADERTAVEIDREAERDIIEVIRDEALRWLSN